MNVDPGFRPMGRVVLVLALLTVPLLPGATAVSVCEPAPFSPCVEVSAGDSVEAGASTSNQTTGLRSPINGNGITVFAANGVWIVATPGAATAAAELASHMGGPAAIAQLGVSPEEGAAGKARVREFARTGYMTGPGFAVGPDGSVMGDAQSSPVGTHVYVGSDGRVFCLRTPDAIVIVASPLGDGIDCSDPVTFVPTADEIMALVEDIVTGGVPPPPSCLPRNCVPPIPL